MRQNRLDRSGKLWKLSSDLYSKCKKRFASNIHSRLILTVVSFSFGNFSYLDFFPPLISLSLSPPTRIASEMFSTFSCQNNPQLGPPLAINEIRRINCEIFIFDVDSLPLLARCAAPRNDFAAVLWKNRTWNDAHKIQQQKIAIFFWYIFLSLIFLVSFLFLPRFLF